MQSIQEILKLEVQYAMNKKQADLEVMFPEETESKSQAPKNPSYEKKVKSRGFFNRYA